MDCVLSLQPGTFSSTMHHNEVAYSSSQLLVMIFTSPPPPPHGNTLSTRFCSENTCCTALQKLSADAPSIEELSPMASIA